MNISQAIVKRIDEICGQQGKNICGACLGGGKSPSALYDLVKGRTKCPKVSTVLAFCEGAGISLGEFFDSELFNGIEDE